MAYLTLPPEFVPEAKTVINWVMSFTPLVSYGTTLLSIRRKKSSKGFSIDICATMLIASTLRVFYYVNDPFEVSLLRQCFVMIFIHVLLLRVAIKYKDPTETAYLRYEESWPEFLRSAWSAVWDPADENSVYGDPLEKASNAAVQYARRAVPVLAVGRVLAIHAVSRGLGAKPDCGPAGVWQDRVAGAGVWVVLVSDREHAAPAADPAVPAVADRGEFQNHTSAQLAGWRPHEDQLPGVRHRQRGDHLCGCCGLPDESELSHHVPVLLLQTHGHGQLAAGDSAKPRKRGNPDGRGPCCGHILCVVEPRPVLADLVVAVPVSGHHADPEPENRPRAFQIKHIQRARGENQQESAQGEPEQQHQPGGDERAE
ncbi:hypothetical protein KL942_004664 [Ogataea angusta]|uniref:Uncharacterized protein n=1 Tax=Pichia angusta TaxID=870730 RepID=A0ABQ7RS93_PICAN|nr:hypothetical protein KL942_004664 [Ogataea angusta]KAG7846438.1 hypothetical protein KL940_004390 [Ogataea angusta]